MAKHSIDNATTLKHQTQQHSLKRLSLTDNNSKSMLVDGVKRQSKGILVRRRSSENARKSLDNQKLDSTGATYRGEEEDLNVIVGDTTASEGSSSDDGSVRRKPRTASNVRFSTIQIREYPMTIGDNPSTEFGPSVELGWKYEQAQPYDVDVHEEDRIAVPRRTEEDLLLSSYKREDLLLELGFSMRQIWNKTHEKDAYRRGVEKSRSKNSLAKLKNAFASIGAEKKRKATQKKNLKKSLSEPTLKIGGDTPRQ